MEHSFVFTVAMSVQQGLSALLFILTFLGAGVWAFGVFVYPFYVSPLRNLPGPTDNAFFLGQTPKFLKVAWLPELFCEWSREFPDAPFIRYLNFANSETLIVNGIASYKEVLQTKSAFFVKPGFARRFAFEFIGDGLPFVEGHLHKVRRAMLAKPFATSRLRTFLPVVQDKAKKFVDLLTAEKTLLGNVEIETHVWKATLDIIGIEIFGLDLNHLQCNNSPLFEAFSKSMHLSVFGHVVNFLNSTVPIRRLLPFKEIRDFAHHTAKVRESIRDHVRARRVSMEAGDSKGGEAPDALQCMMEHWDESWGYDEIVEYVYNLLVLGHDTTACSIIWAIHELSRRLPDQQRLRDEITGLTLNDRVLTYNEIEKLPFLNNFVREVLRMYCAVALSPRQAVEDVNIAGTLIPKGTVLQLSPAVMNLHPLIWGKDATTFNADRWDNLAGDNASAYAFETFHNGPRMCIGKQLSIMEMKVFLMELISRFQIEAVDGGKVEVAKPTFTLRMKDKLVVRLAEL